MAVSQQLIDKFLTPSIFAKNLEGYAHAQTKLMTNAVSLCLADN